MLSIGITGAQGFLGWHLRAYLHARRDVKVSLATRAVFEDSKALQRFVGSADAVVHLAGMNRGAEEDIENTNIGLTSSLIAACEEVNARPHIVFANSAHLGRNDAYGRSKRRSSDALAGWACRSGGRYTDIVLPGVFGEHGRPFYNSVVSTFCDQLARGDRPSIHEDREIELLHAQEVASRIVAVITSDRFGTEQLNGRRITVSRLLEQLRGMDESYRKRMVIPPLDNPFDLALFNSFRSYLYPQHYPVPLQIKSDARGGLFEAVKTLHGGQCFLSYSKPGITRGNHYHTAKIERFVVIEGDAIIRLRRLFFDQIVEYRVTGTRPSYIDMPTFHTHNITNIGRDNLLVLFWSHEIFDPNNPDTYAEAP